MGLVVSLKAPTTNELKSYFGRHGMIDTLQHRFFLEEGSYRMRLGPISAI